MGAEKLAPGPRDAGWRSGDQAPVVKDDMASAVSLGNIAGCEDIRSGPREQNSRKVRAVLATEVSAQVRRQRKDWREAVERGDVGVADLLADTPPELARVKLLDLLRWQHYVGATRARKLARECGIRGRLDHPVDELRLEAIEPAARQAIVARLQSGVG